MYDVAGLSIELSRASDCIGQNRAITSLWLVRDFVLTSLFDLLHDQETTVKQRSCRERYLK